MNFTFTHPWTRIVFIFSGLSFLAFLATSCLSDAKGEAPLSFDPAKVAASSLSFIENKGQWDSRILFKARMNGGEVLFEKDRITWHFFELPPRGDHPHDYSPNVSLFLKGHVVSTFFEGFSAESKLEGEVIEPYYYNYFLGNDSTKWASKVPIYKKIIYKDLYPGIDLRIYGYGSQLKYDFVVLPGVEPKQIKLSYEGTDQIGLEGGRLKWETSVRNVTENAPYSYLQAGDNSVPVASRYVLRGSKLSFAFPDGYDSSYPLVIDPTMVFSTYSGSTSDNWGFTATYDDDGNSYAGGIEVSVNNNFQDGYPTRTGAYQVRNNGGEREVTISKFNPQGNSLVYATYLGGSAEDQPHSLIATNTGELVVFGRTNSQDFPTPNGFDPSYNGGFDMFVAKFSADGSQLISATYLGGGGDDGVNGSASVSDYSAPTKFNYGDDARGEVFLDRQGNVLLAGPTKSSNFPFSSQAYSNVFAGGQVGVIARLSPNLDALQWATSIGGNGVDAIYTVKVDEDNNVFFAGGTSSTNLFANGVRSSSSGDAEGYIGKLSSDGRNLLHATYLGTNAYDQIYLMDIDQDGDVYVSGQTMGNFIIVNPLAGNVYQNNGAKQFVSKLNPELDRILYSTTIGSPNSNFPNISPTAMLVDICENVYVTGWGGVTNTVGNTNGMITIEPDQATTDGSDLYIFVLSRDAQDLTYASFLGGNGTAGGLTGEHVDGGTCRFDKNGVVYHAVCAQCGTSADFPTTPGSYSPQNGYPDNCNLALFKLAFDLEGVRADFTIENVGDTIFGCAPFMAGFENRSYQGANPGGDLRYEWDFGINGQTSSDFEPTFEYVDPGIYEVRLIISDPQSCNLADTAYKTLSVLPPPLADAGQDLLLCPGEETQLNATGGEVYAWSPSAGLSDPSIPNPMLTGSEARTYTLTVTDEAGCTDTDQLDVGVKDATPIQVVEDKRTCAGVPTLIQAWSNTGDIVSYSWSPSVGLSDPNIGSPIASPEVTTEYVVTALDVQGCETVDTVRVEILPRPQTEIDGVNKTCNGEGIIELRASGGDFYVWSTGDTATVIEVNEPLSPFSFVATGYIGECEGIPDTIVVDSRFDYPEASFVPSPEDAYAPATIQFQNTTIGGDTYLWQFGFGARQSIEENPSFTFPFEGEYEVQLIAQTEFGCADTFSRILEIFPTILSVPTAFSPNGDGINDEFLVVNNGIEVLNLKIFNQWGALIYEASSPGFKWNGTYKGEGVPEGVYIWTIEAEGKNGRKYPYTGSVSIIR